MKSPELATFWEHAEELKKTLLRVLLIIGVGFLTALFFYKPLIQLVKSNCVVEHLVLFGPIEGIGIIIKLSFWVGCIATSPFWLYCILVFIAPALSERQQTLIVPFHFFSLLFLFGGMAFAYFVTIPFSNSYLWALNATLGENVWGLATYLDYTVFLMLSNGLIFESCLSLLLLVHFGILTEKKMAAKRKLFIVAAFIVSAILTPPDVVTQVLMALPLIALYECAILYARFTQMRSRLSCSSK